jgi:hypothetical protein
MQWYEEHPWFFPDETESDSSSFYALLRDYTGDDKEQYRDSSTSGSFGWVRRWIIEKIDLDSDIDSHEKEYTDNTG